MSKPFPALCCDCKWSKIDSSSAWDLHCTNPKVNARDPWALSHSTGRSGSHCRDERSKMILGACGMRGRRWEAK